MLILFLFSKLYSGCVMCRVDTRVSILETPFN